MRVLRIGVLAMQGSVEEHLRMLARLDDVQGFAVRTCDELALADGLILPGGESTAQARLLRDFGLLDVLVERIRAGLPVWGTCAGLILLAGDIVGEQPHLGLMAVTVRRNAYGRQLDSFRRQISLPAVSAQPVDLVFIRAPWIEQVQAPAEVLATVDGHIVAARQGRMLGTSFHPELTGDPAFHRYFAGMVRAAC